MANNIAVNRNALKAANQAVDKSLDERRNALNEILRKIAPDGSIVARARKIGVSRQTLYDWMTGRSYPNRLKAKQLAKLTGIPVEIFRP